jgi:prepilin-type N-terminal cleavage/methylation domain-containing protein/prepilin-type processing-associated H-X9-DG protein
MSSAIKNRVRSQVHAFTLVEMLVVISVISLLVAMLLPALASARDSGRTVTCVSNQRSFMQGLQIYLSDANELWPAHAATASAGDGTVYFTSLFTNSYLSAQSMICPTVPSIYAFRYGLYNPYNRNDVVFRFHYRGQPAYGVPFGTYSWFGGSVENSASAIQPWRYWANNSTVPGTAASKFQFYSYHIGDPSRYSPIWDQDSRRGTTFQGRDYYSHSFNPGRTFAFADGHAKFYADTSPEVAGCTLPNTNFLRGAEHITPHFNDYQVMFASSMSVHGTTFNNAGPSNPRPAALTRGILTIPSN